MTSMAEFIFYSIATGACVFAFLTVLSRDIFHSAIWLALTLLSIAGIYFYLDAEFLGVIQVLVYVGGIITLFIFAIKLTAHIGDTTIRQTNKQVLLSSVVSIIFFYLLFKIIGSNPWASNHQEAQTISLKQIGESLMTGYVLPFEFISLLLLAAMVGAIVIGKVKK